MTFPWQTFERLPKRLPLSLGFSRYALDFDSVNNYVDCGDFDVEKITIWAYINCRGQVADRGTIMGKRAGGITSYHLSIELGTNRPRLYITTGGGTDNFIHTQSIPLNQEVYIVGTYDGTTMRIFFSPGGPIESAVHAWGGNISASINTVVLGTRTAGTNDDMLNGLIAEAGEYNRAITEREMLYNMREYHKVIAAGLVLWLRMEEGTGLTAYDQSGQGNDGNLLPALTPPSWTRNRMWELRAEVGL